MEHQPRTIKSFVLRTGRVSNRQQHALDHWLQDYVLPMDGNSWDLDLIFARKAHTVVEIGFGMGASLFTMAKDNPHLNFIGIEVHRAGLGSLVADVYEHQLQNIRIVPEDAVTVFKQQLSLQTLAGIQVFFPDPWHKKRHHKRRLIQTEFVKLLEQTLKPGGFIHAATDWEDYALQMQTILDAHENLEKNMPENIPNVQKALKRPTTRFEQRGKRLGHDVWDLIYYKKNMLAYSNSQPNMSFPPMRG